jgi:hypothetical protein
MTGPTCVWLPSADLYAELPACEARDVTVIGAKCKCKRINKGSNIVACVALAPAGGQGACYNSEAAPTPAAPTPAADEITDISGAGTAAQTRPPPTNPERPPSTGHTDRCVGRELVRDAAPGRRGQRQERSMVDGVYFATRVYVSTVGYP